MIAPPDLALDSIVSFSGPYWFLANPFGCPVMHDGLLFPSAEHAFQAAKTLDWQTRQFMASLPWREAKAHGRRLPLRPGWDRLRRAVMLQVVLDKFIRSPDLGAALAATGNRTLVEGNTWGDDQWGAVPPSAVWRTAGSVLPVWHTQDWDTQDGYLVGHNWLGWTLMTVRDVLTEVS